MLHKSDCAVRKQRIEWIDITKGYGILFVIIAHCHAGKIGTWFYTFHIPLFFIISGYLFSYKKDFKAYIKRKIKSLVIPYFCLGIPMILFSLLVHLHAGAYSFSDFVNLSGLFMIQERMWTIWFLACLFCVDIIFYFINRFCQTTVKIGACCIALAVFGYFYYYFGGSSLPWDVDAALMALPFFFAGRIIKLKKNDIDGCLENRKKSILLFLICGLLNIGLAYLNLKLGFSNLEMYRSSYGCFPLVYSAAIFGSLALIIFSRWFTVLPIQYLGKSSLLYFAWHQTIFKLLCGKFLSTIGWNMTNPTSVYTIIVYKFVYIALILIALTMCNMIIFNTKLKFMLGK